MSVEPQPADLFALTLALALEDAQRWHEQGHAALHAYVQGLAAGFGSRLGSIGLPEPVVPSHGPQLLGLLSSLYLVNELEPLIQAAENLLGLWSSGAMQLRLPELEPALAKAWRERRLRLAATERQHLLGLVFDPQEFDPAMQTLCTCLTALADNAQQHDVREEVGLQHAAQTVLELAATRLEGAPAVASTDLLGQLREATHWLADKKLQMAMGARSLQDLARMCLLNQPDLASSLRNRMDRARAGSVVLQWLAGGASTGFAVNPRDAGLQTVIASAQVWLLASVPARLSVQSPTSANAPLMTLT